MRRELCESAKKGRVCIDDLCRGADVTLCGFDKDAYDEMLREDDFDDDGCYECGGEGFIVADCFEDSCCCADPEMDHGLIPCPLCKPVEQRRGSQC